MIEHQFALGTIDPSAGMEIGELAKSYEGFTGKADRVLGYMEGVTREMPRAVEAINRAVTAHRSLSLGAGTRSYARAAVKYSTDAVNNTQFNYSPTNSPRYSITRFTRWRSSSRSTRREFISFLAARLERLFVTRARVIEPKQ